MDTLRNRQHRTAPQISGTHPLYKNVKFLLPDGLGSVGATYTTSRGVSTAAHPQRLDLIQIKSASIAARGNPGGAAKCCRARLSDLRLQ